MSGGNRIQPAGGASTGNVSRLPLPRWRAALGARSAKIAFVGDSLTEGTGASTEYVRFIALVCARLRAYYGLGAGGIGFTPAGTFQGPTTKFWSTTGPTANVQTRCPGGNALNLQATSTATCTFVGTDADVWYWSGTGSGPFSVTVDGGAPVTVTPPGGTLTNNGVYTGIRGLANTSHTVVIAPTTATTAYIDGLCGYAGDVAGGIIGADFGHFGWKASDYFTALGNAWAPQRITAYSPDLMVCFLGLNDVQTTAPATFIANIAAIVNVFNTASATPPSWLFVSPYRRTDDATLNYVAMNDALRTFAATDAVNYSFLPLGTMVDPRTQPYGMFVDQVHPNDKGHSWLADQIVSALL